MVNVKQHSRLVEKKTTTNMKKNIHDSTYGQPSY